MASEVGSSRTDGVLTRRRLLGGATLAGLAALGGPTVAAAGAVPHTHRIDDVSWDTESQAFVISLSVQQVMLEVQDYLQFRARIRIRAGGSLVGVTEPVTSPIIMMGTPDADGFVPVEPVTVPWDRNGGAFSSPDATVIASVVMLSTRERLEEAAVPIS